MSDIQRDEKEPIKEIQQVSALNKIDDEKYPIDASADNKLDSKHDYDTKGSPANGENFDDEQELDSEHIIRTGHDVSEYLLSIRDDGDPSLTFRSVFLGIIVSAFQATMTQIYFFKPTNANIGGSFMVLIIYFVGIAWAKFLPSGPGLKARWGNNPESNLKRILVGVFQFINPGSFGLKEHAVAAITASSASNGIEALTPFTSQLLFYDVPLTKMTVIFSLLSSGLFGYGLTGLLRPLIIWPVQMVYWGNIPLVQQFQRLHWDNLESKPLRWFWYAFIFMTVYEFVPAYMFPMLVAVSIPCLAAQNAPESKRKLLTNLFGGSVSNEGLGLFSICLDWQYIGSGITSLPLIWQANTWIGMGFCYIIFLSVYYGNAFGARDLPFMSPRLYQQDNEKYPTSELFANGTLNKTVLAEHGLPRLTATFAWGMFTGLAAIGALIMHTFLFYGKQMKDAFREARQKKFTDRHHRAVIERYREVHWLWYGSLLVIAFFLGLIANLAGKTTLPIKGYFLALTVGTIIAPFSAILYAQFGSGVNTHPIMKMISGLALPERPLAILYFDCWSHSCVSQAINLACDLKMGVTYLKIPPYIMFITQVIGTVFGAFINYAVMISIVNNQKEVLLLNNGSQTWSGQFFQGVNLQATVWSLSRQLYGIGKPYMVIPMGFLVGLGSVVLQRLITKFVVSKIGMFDLQDINLPLIWLYLGWFALQTQTCVIFSIVLAGIYVQFYLRNYKPKIFKEYAYLIAAGLDGGSLLTIFVLSFAVFGASSTPKPFPTWWGNPSGYPDHCPEP